MKIKFGGQVSKKEFKQASRIMYSRVLLSTRLFFGIVLIILTVALIYTVISSKLSLREIVFPAVFGYALFTFPWWFPFLLSSSYDRDENIYRTPVHGIINENGISIEGRQQKLNPGWEMFNGYHLGENLVLIYQGKNGFNIFTRELFAAETDWAQFKGLLGQKIQTK